MVKLNKNLATRFSAEKLFEKLFEIKQIQLDFKNVELVSRSFVNEFDKLEKQFNFKIKKINMKKEIIYMFENADKELSSDLLSKNKFSTVSVEKYASLI